MLALVASFLAGVVVTVPATVLAGRLRPRRRAGAPRAARIEDASAAVPELRAANGSSQLPTSTALPLEGERHGRDPSEVLAYDGPRRHLVGPDLRVILVRRGRL